MKPLKNFCGERKNAGSKVFEKRLKVKSCNLPGAMVRFSYERLYMLLAYPRTRLRNSHSLLFLRPQLRCLLPVTPDHNHSQEAPDHCTSEQCENDGYPDRPDAGREE